MKFSLLSVPVSDQYKGLGFYTNTLGFVTKRDTPLTDFGDVKFAVLDDAYGNLIQLYQETK